ncbi:MAG: chloride channel protein [Bacteroidota bacterium]
MWSKRLLVRFFAWRSKHLKQRQFILILSLLIGILSGLAAVLLKNIVHFVHHHLTAGFQLETENILYLFYPIIGIIITVLFVKYIVKADIGHGVSKILYAMSKRNGYIDGHNSYTSMIASTFTVGFGGSVGLESPIVLTGASIGSNIGRFFRLNYKTVLLLIGCGSSAAIAGIFNAPIAGLVFTLEVLMLDLTMASIIPLLIAAVTGTVVSFFLMEKGVLFAFGDVEPFLLENIPHYIILGVFAGLVSIYFTRGTMFVEEQFHKIHRDVTRFVIGGVILSVLIFLFPSLYGEGYTTLLSILQGNVETVTHNSFFYEWKESFWFLILYLLFVIFFKVIAMSVTTASGGVGGIFAPSLFTGGFVGLVAAMVINRLSLGQVPMTSFALVGMAGVMAGVMHAPLTSIFLIAEITGGYELFIPLIITSTISFLTINYIEPHSIYTKRLAIKGQLMTHHKDKVALSRLSVNKLIERNFLTVDENASLGELVKIIAKSERNVFPVVDKENNFKGVVFINEIRDIIFKPEMYDKVNVIDLMFMPDVSIASNESMESVATKFQKSQHYNIPVVDKGKYVGFVSRARVFSKYRELVKEFSDD